MNRTARAPLGAALLVLLITPACAGTADGTEPRSPGEPAPGYAEARARMVERDLAGRGIADATVLEAMGRVPRHRFVPDSVRDEAYADHPLPIGLRQTISQPYIVALMTELADLDPGDRVLEIGTGSGYQAAVLAEIVEQVYSIEILAELSRRSTALLIELGYENIETRVGDGYRGWPEAAPFDAILVTAAPPEVPEPLIEQLAIGGKMIIPVGRSYQELLVLEKTEKGVQRRRSIPVRFVPMTGEARE